MKSIRIILILSAFIIIFILVACSSSKKGSHYPKRLQRSVKCSACKSDFKSIKSNNIKITAYYKPSDIKTTVN